MCGYDACVVNLHFHHVDPTQKSFGLSMNTTKALAAYREELKKCVLLCANCHGEVEAGLLVGPPAGSRYNDKWAPSDSNRVCEIKSLDV